MTDRGDDATGCLGYGAARQPDSARPSPAWFFRRLADWLAGGEQVALCTMLGVVGSAPRHAGAKMAVRASGELLGTIGGGRLEARSVEWGREVLATAASVRRGFVLTEEMVCGGTAELLVEYLDGRDSATASFFRLVTIVAEGDALGCSVLGMRREQETVLASRALFAGRQRLATLATERCPIPDDLYRTTPHVPALIHREPGDYFLEPLAPPITVVVCGGGHIAAALVPLCGPLGFRTIVLDDRPEYAAAGRFPGADQVRAVASFDQALEHIPLGPGTYVVIVTHGHAGDLAVARQALRGTPGYLGMIGSRRKRDVLFEALRREGCSAEASARIACPIGLAIGAETPEEIAVSIVAQLIATRAAQVRRDAP